MANPADLLVGLPMECSFHDYNNPESIEAGLRTGWSDTYSTRAAVIERALAYADPGGQVSHDLVVDRAVARELLQSRGFVNVLDFFPDDNGYLPHPSEGRPDDLIEVGWSVKYQYKEDYGLGKALKVVESTLSDLRQEHVQDSVQGVQGDATALETKVVALLKASSSSIRYADIEYAHSHTDYPAGGRISALQFTIPGNHRVEFKFTTGYETT